MRNALDTTEGQQQQRMHIQSQYEQSRCGPLSRFAEMATRTRKKCAVPEKTRSYKVVFKECGKTNKELGFKKVQFVGFMYYC